jgi:hypothetical protein
MTVPNPTRLPGDPIPPPEPPYPWKVGVGMVGLVALVLVVVWLAFQLVKGPPTAGEFPSPATATAIQRDFVATVSAADTARPRSTSRPATSAPTVAPTTAPAALPAPTAVRASTPQPATTEPDSAGVSTVAVSATPASTAQTITSTQPLVPSAQAPTRLATPIAAGGSESAAPTPWPTVNPALEEEVSDAYLHYWQVVADTALTLDPVPLAEVAAGEQLSVLEKNLAEDSSNNHATRMKVQHDFVVVSVNSDQAEVADQLRDLSIVVDASTHEPLPDQADAASIDSIPPINAILDLRRIDGTWKVVTAGKALEQAQTP